MAPAREWHSVHILAFLSTWLLQYSKPCIKFASDTAAQPAISCSAWVRSRRCDDRGASVIQNCALLLA